MLKRKPFSEHNFLLRNYLFQTLSHHSFYWGTKNFMKDCWYPMGLLFIPKKKMTYRRDGDYPWHRLCNALFGEFRSEWTWPSSKLAKTPKDKTLRRKEPASSSSILKTTLSSFILSKCLQMKCLLSYWTEHFNETNPNNSGLILSLVAKTPKTLISYTALQCRKYHS